MSALCGREVATLARPRLTEVSLEHVSAWCRDVEAYVEGCQVAGVYPHLRTMMSPDMWAWFTAPSGVYARLGDAETFPLEDSYKAAPLPTEDAMAGDSAGAIKARKLFTRMCLHTLHRWVRAARREVLWDERAVESALAGVHWTPSPSWELSFYPFAQQVAQVHELKGLCLVPQVGGSVEDREEPVGRGLQKVAIRALVRALQPAAWREEVAYWVRTSLPKTVSQFLDWMAAHRDTYSTLARASALGPSGDLKIGSGAGHWGGDAPGGAERERSGASGQRRDDGRASGVGEWPEEGGSQGAGRGRAAPAVLQGCYGCGGRHRLSECPVIVEPVARARLQELARVARASVSRGAGSWDTAPERGGAPDVRDGGRRRGSWGAGRGKSPSPSGSSGGSQGFGSATGGAPAREREDPTLMVRRLQIQPRPMAAPATVTVVPDSVMAVAPEGAVNGYVAESTAVEPSDCDVSVGGTSPAPERGSARECGHGAWSVSGPEGHAVSVRVFVDTGAAATCMAPATAHHITTHAVGLKTVDAPPAVIRGCMQGDGAVSSLAMKASGLVAFDWGASGQLRDVTVLVVPGLDTGGVVLGCDALAQLPPDVWTPVVYGVRKDHDAQGPVGPVHEVVGPAHGPCEDVVTQGCDCLEPVVAHVDVLGGVCAPDEGPDVAPGDTLVGAGASTSRSSKIKLDVEGDVAVGHPSHLVAEEPGTPLEWGRVTVENQHAREAVKGRPLGSGCWAASHIVSKIRWAPGPRRPRVRQRRP